VKKRILIDSFKKPNKHLACAELEIFVKIDETFLKEKGKMRQHHRKVLLNSINMNAVIVKDFKISSNILDILNAWLQQGKGEIHSQKRSLHINWLSVCLISP